MVFEDFEQVQVLAHAYDESVMKKNLKKEGKKGNQDSRKEK